jgi:catechol 2,3-dioxygenase-like lactoylglutathione lyase family enzyme
LFVEDLERSKAFYLDVFGLPVLFETPTPSCSNSRWAGRLDGSAKQRQKAISIKLPEALLERTREEAKRRGVPYQTLIKILFERSLDRLGAA